MAEPQEYTDLRAVRADPPNLPEPRWVMTGHQAEGLGLDLLRDTASVLENLDDSMTEKIRFVETVEEKVDREEVQVELRRVLEHLGKGIRPFRMSFELEEDQPVDNLGRLPDEDVEMGRAFRLGLRHLYRTKVGLEELIAYFTHCVNVSETLWQKDEAEDIQYELQMAMETLIEGSELVNPY